MAKYDINLSYPRSKDYRYEARLIRANIEEEMMHSISSGNGFFIKSNKSTLKKQMKDADGIYSPRYGKTLDDINPYSSRYACECGRTDSTIRAGMKCKVCGTEVKYVDDNFEYTGWAVLKDPYYIIHPNLFKSLESLIGKKELLSILRYTDERDLDGYIIKKENVKVADTYKNIGMMAFKQKFQDICDFYVKRKPQKRDVYEDIMREKDKVFIQSIPVYSALLRPMQQEGTKLFYEETNAIYTIMTKYVSDINNDDLMIYRKIKSRNELLFKLNMKYMDLYKEIESIMSGKKGIFRNLFGGRHNFTSRDVIVPDPKLRIDEVTLPYAALVELLEQSIKNVLVKSYNISFSDAHNIWVKAQSEQDPRVRRIIEEIIANTGRGIPVLINRNPTIARGGILQMFCVGINDAYIMGMPLQILKILAADFDGDVLNVLYIINQAFLDSAFRILNPRNAFYINNDDGALNEDVLFSRDTVINANALINLSRKNYNEEQLAKIQKIKELTECI